MKKFNLFVIFLLITCFICLISVGCQNNNSNNNVNDDYYSNSSNNNNGYWDNNDSSSTSNGDTNNSQNENLYNDSISKIKYDLEEDVDSTITKLETEWISLKNSITSYAIYTQNVDKIQTYYDKVNSETEQLCNRMYGYTLRYGKIILSSDNTSYDMYDDFDIIYDDIYDNAGDDIYDEIYNGILDDMYDTFYNGVIDDAYDTVPYSEWFDYHSDEYDNWSDTRSDVYDSWSDMRSDIYDVWSDIRSDLFDDDLDEAAERLLKFENKINSNY